ncbi:hypothetical protein E3N88_15150 [Mikania micrantha]|uniref:Uncharacterized protein n=1 Tax=Mikania micrantha TaxID=192012 RepID=A0A5N6NUK8_9ASTR|nr:hypothetical protein E3N88_15150 [Mikania micrantha]
MSCDLYLYEELSVTTVGGMLIQITYHFFHWKKGTPFAEDQGIYNRLTWWEQIDSGKQLTRNRKFLTVVPVVLPGRPPTPKSRSCLPPIPRWRRRWRPRRVPEVATLNQTCDGDHDRTVETLNLLSLRLSSDVSDDPYVSDGPCSGGGEQVGREGGGRRLCFAEMRREEAILREATARSGLGMRREKRRE